jgi:hypothetical protein
MSRVDEPLTQAGIWEAAAMTLAQHEDRGTSYAPGTCACCRPDGCPQLRWAREVQAGRDAVYPVDTPVPPNLGAIS